MAHTGRVARDFATRLQDLPAVARVLHPALPTSPGHAVWARDFKGSSAVFSIVVKPECRDRLYPAMSSLRMFAIGASSAGTRSLIAPMEIAADRTVRPWDPAEPLVRFSIGLKEEGELWADLACFLAALAEG